MAYMAGGMLGRAAGRGIKSGAKYAAGAAALGTGALLRQAASPIPGGTATMTAGLGLAGAMGSAAYGKGFGGGKKDKEGGAGAGGAIKGGMEKIGEGLKNLVEPLEVIKANTNTIKDILLEMRNKAYEDAIKNLKKVQGPPTAALAAQVANSTSGPGKDPTQKMGTGMKLLLAGLALSVARRLKSLMKFFGRNGAIANGLRGLKTFITDSKVFKNFKTFFGKGGGLSTRLNGLKLAITESKAFTGLKNIFGKGGTIATKLKNIKDGFALVKGGLVTKFTNMFGKGGTIATRLSNLKAAALGGGGQPGVLTKVADGAKNLIKGGADKVKGFAKAAKGGAIDIFTKGMNKIKGILQGVKDIGSKIIKFVTANPLFSKIGAIAKTFGALLGRIFTPILVLWSLFEGVMGAKDSVEEEGKKADSDMLTKIYAGIGGFVGGIVGFLIGGILDLGVSIGAWIAGKLGFTETKAMMQGFLKEKGGFTGLIKSLFTALYSIPIAIWNWMKGLLGFGEAESDAGKAGAGFVDKFKSTLMEAFQKISDLIPNMDDIPALAAGIMGKIQAWFGKQLVSIGEWFSGMWMPGAGSIGDFFKSRGESMISGGNAMISAGEKKMAANKAARIEADTGTAQGNAAATSQSVMTEGFGGGTSVTNVNNNSYGGGSDSDGFSIAPVPAARESFNRKDRYAVARGNLGGFQ
jgi:hypothetical protein